MGNASQCPYLPALAQDSLGLILGFGVGDEVVGLLAPTRRLRKAGSASRPGSGPATSPLCS